MSNRGYILLISHMRSHSTLLAHILGSHPEIDGYTELHQHYESPIDLRNMTRRIEEHTGSRRRGRYAFDKLLHNRGMIDGTLLRRDDVKVLFLVRRPAGSIPSIMRACRFDEHVTAGATPEGATHYYVTRLQRIDAYSELLGPRAQFVAAEELVSKTEHVLARLTRYLELDTPLSPEYEQFKHTGQRGLGDPGPNILAGRVLQDHERDRGGDVEPVPDDLKAQAVAAYDALVPKLIARHPDC